MSIPSILWLIGIPLAASPAIYLAGRLGRKAFTGEHASNPARWVALLALLAAWIPLIQAGREVIGKATSSLDLGSISIQVDGLTLLLAAVVLGLATLVTLFSGPYVAGDDGEEKFYALLTAMTGAIIGLGAANDLFNLWVWFETMAIASFMLVAFYRGQSGALEAGVKYLVQSAVGSVLVLLGIAIVFGETGTLNLKLIQTHFMIQSAPITPGMLAAGALFVIGFGVKAALVPLHTWLPDAHSQAPSGISAMLSGVVIEAGLVAMLRALGALNPVSTHWGTLLMGFGAANMLLGNLLALRQTQVKRMLAFSSLSHVGYMLVGLGVGISYHSLDGAQGGLFHLLNHGMMKGLAFLAAGTLLYALYASRGRHDPLTIADLGGAARRYPLAAFTLSVALLGLGGLPPLSGFMSKWQIFLAGFQTQNPWVVTLVLFAALNSVLSLGYYAPLVNAMYRRTPSEIVQQGAPIPAVMNAPLIILAAGVILLGVWPSLVGWFTGPAGASLLAAFGG